MPRPVRRWVNVSLPTITWIFQNRCQQGEGQGWGKSISLTHEVLIRRKNRIFDYQSLDMKKIITLFFLCVYVSVGAQVVYEDINNVGIYEFLDELANLKVIEINSVVKPYSRQYIAEKLMETYQQLSSEVVEWGSGKEKGKEGKRVVTLNKRQRKELMFYLQDYQIDLGCGMHDAGYAIKGIKGHRDTMGSGKRESHIPDRGSKCYLEYDDKLGFLFKNNPVFAVPLNPLAFQYKDRLFTLSIRPILGITYIGNENGSATHMYWGGSMFGYIGKNLGFYASLRDNKESIAMAKPEYLTLAQGQVYKGKPGGGVYFSEMRGGITVSWNWGSFGLMNDRFEWGNNYHGTNILSGKAPSFPYIQLHIKPVKWLDFNYIHGWLYSNVIDSSRSYYTSNDDYRIVYRNKYIATNMFTVIPFKRLNISFGNSIIYSDINIHPLYLIPFMFYNAVDASRTGYTDAASSNSQLFFDISSRQIKHLHLYATLFIDELKMSRVTDPDLYNFTSWKAGFRVSDFPLQNLSFTFEWTKTNPITYKHYILTTTYASSGYSLGHYLRDNSYEYYFAIGYKPIRGLSLQVSYTLATHGDEFQYDNSQSTAVERLPYMKNKTWQNSEIAVSARYEYTANAYFFMEYLNSTRSGDVRYQPGLMHGKTNTFVAGVNIGF